MQGEPTKCPYSEVCKCPAGPDFKPIKGLWRQEDGIQCLDFDIFLPYSLAAKVPRTEGRHIADAVEAADKIDIARRRWSKNPKRRAAQKKYDKGPKGKVTKKKHSQTESFKLSYQKYYYSKKGQEAHMKDREKKKQFRVIQKWLKESPGKTIDDYFKEHSES